MDAKKKDESSKSNIRAYFSELTTDTEYKPAFPRTGIASPSNIKLIWRVANECNSPFLQSLQPTDNIIDLAPAAKWITWEEDPKISFPVDTFKPKVQLEYKVEPNTLPRKVAIERRRRDYESKNIFDLFSKYKIEFKDLLPIKVLQEYCTSPGKDVYDLHNPVSFLALGEFDDNDFDCRTPQDWLDLSFVDGALYPLLGLAFLPSNKQFSKDASKDTILNNLYQWQNVAVTAYDFDSNLWSLSTVDGNSYKVPKIYLMFKAEDPEMFCRRIRAALDARWEAESQIRYNFFIDGTNLEGLSDIEPNLLKTIVKSATRNNVMKISNREFYDQSLHDLNENHKKTLASIQLVKHQQKDELLPESLRNLCKQQCTKTRSIFTKMTNFKQTKNYFRWNSIYVIPETYWAQCLVFNECLKIEEMDFFTWNFGAKYISLDDFVQVQLSHANLVIKHLQGEYLNNLVINIRMCLRDVGKGWFSINQKVYEVYEISKLKRFMDLIKFRMQYSIRLLVEKSMETFISMLETPCLCCMGVSPDFEWDQNDLFKNIFESSSPPLFTINLKMDSTKASYCTDPDKFEPVLVALFDKVLKMSHEIKQVHPFLLTNLRFAQDLYLSSIGLLADEVVRIRNRFIKAYQDCIIPLKAYAQAYDVFLDIFNLDIDAYIENFTSEEHTAAEVEEEVHQQFNEKRILEETMPCEVFIGPFHIAVKSLRMLLISKREALCQKLLKMFADRMKYFINEVLSQYEDIMTKLLESPRSIEHIFEIREWMETVPATVKAQQENVTRYLLEYQVLDSFYYDLPQEDFENKWEAIGWPYKIKQQVQYTEELFRDLSENFYKIQLSDEVAMEETIEGYTVQVLHITHQDDYNKTKELAIDIKRLWKAMKDSQEFGILLNERQRLFNTPVVPFDSLNKLIKQFEPYKTLWLTSSDWLRSHEMWMDNPMITIDGDGIDRTVTEMYKQMGRLVRVFNENEVIKNIAATVRKEIDEFKPFIPLIQSLRNPGMKQRHWDQFRKSTGLQILWNDTVTFKDFLLMGIAEHGDILAKLSEEATKEYAIEQALQKMKGEWHNNLLDLTLYKNTGTYIVKVSDENQQMLDDHIMLTQQLSFSPFKGPFEDEINKWEQSLRTTSAVLEEWIDVQRQWMYLEPIFASPDITTQLPSESKKFKSVERTWRRIMRGAYEQPKLISYCNDLKLLESLRDANHVLEVVQKGLSQYLETKRIVFPRLYFLSDDELLEILSQARNPLAVQPHLRKCFENIARLTFEEDLRITQMFSAEEECVDLNPTLYPTGNVEQWLAEVETVMKNTVRTILGASLEDMQEKSRKDWVLLWPGQVVIAASQTYWTAGVEEGIRSNTLSTFFGILLENLDALRGLVKGHLTFIQREILSALIVIEVHSRDVTQNLVDYNVTNANDFDWISQLRYYWKVEDLKVCAVNAEFQYGYEYLGNSGRLVITPLTDRCYLTLTGALHLKFGGAPAGPAGTGKTETTKDLAKAMAIQCVVFNCSDQLDFMAMGKFFKGLASSGAWACFDEFNRIDIEVLSVVAQQITTIQKAQQSRLNRFFFEGSEIALKESCAVFITMNPGYAGRTELPDNLKALFRPVSMMVPNYTLIAEISLFSFGFSNARQLANKITTTFKLSSEQLSTQDHYDFGMRAVKTVIAVAGNLKREQPEMDEAQIVLRSLRDVNVPKFLKDDLKLFSGIVSDLFPRMVEQVIDYGVLEKSIRSCCVELLLEPVDEFVKKVIQLYETTLVRHGLMLVGPTGSGKTKNYQVLQMAMTKLEGQSQPSGRPFEPVDTYVLNPKSITMGQLYGQFDLQTHEWTDGILPSLVRLGVSAEDKHKRWYVFDGPVDAVWIENMNTVLDDNKKLCLSSGEIIKLRDTMTMVFEVADLAVASPATVSRCGMVYMEPANLGLMPFINCWVSQLCETMEKYKDKLLELFKIYVLPAIELVRNKLKEVLTSIDSALLQCFLNLMTWRLFPVCRTDKKPLPLPVYLNLIPDLLVPWTVFCVIWSIGCTCNFEGRKIFDQWLRARLAEHNHGPMFPENGLCYDFKLHDGGFSDPTDDNEPHPASWINWMTNVESIEISLDMKYSDIEVPTIDNVRNSAMLGVLLLNSHNVLCVGPTGTGKTMSIVAKLGKNMPKHYVCDFISFSARTSANQTQDLIDSKLDRRRRGIFGPPVTKQQIFFIDDFNMPALEVYGAQPPIELVRQWMDFGGWYDRKNIGEFRKIVDTNFVTAMGPPGGGRNPVTARLLRHFHYITFLEMEDDSKATIFGRILNFWLKLNDTGNIFKYYDSILNSTISVYNTILRELLPTPVKTHYTFNLRDLSKVFQGMLMFESVKLKNVEHLVRLWYHECCRVFEDRLINDEDRGWFQSLLKEKISHSFKLDPETTLRSDSGLILYGDLADPNAGYYVEMDDMNQLNTSLTFYLGEYNAQSTKPMNLVLFLDAVGHLCRIARIIRQPMGNALLLGVGGSGRQSLTNLAAFIAEYFCFQIELSKSYGMNEWREDIKRLMLSAGVNKYESVFLFSDTQIKSEAFLEDLNNILNSGDVPNIYQAEELDKIFQATKSLVQELGMIPSKSNMFAFYQKEVRARLHTVISMSPIGEVFRARLRQFPALVNCCTIDWFQPWPDTALQSVALQYLSSSQDLSLTEEVRDGIVNVFQYMHASVVEASLRYKAELSRHNYVTPTSYLELLSSYTELLQKRRTALQEGVGRLRIGLGKLQSTSDEVKVLQDELALMTPALEEAATQAEIMIKKIAADTLVAEETKALVEKEQEEATQKAIITQTIAADAQKDLDEAMPALLAAENSLKSLNKNDIAEVRSMKHPPAGVVFVMETICIVKDIKPFKTLGPDKKPIYDYWESARNMLADPTMFLASLMNFDKESLNEEMIEKLKNYVENESFTPAKIARVSKACTSFCMWVHAMYKYYFVNKVVAPKKAALQQAKEDLEATEKALASAKAHMQEILQGLEELNKNLEVKVRFKKDKEEKMAYCQERMNRAVRLITGLADEKLRWTETITGIDNSVKNMIGDILISAGCVAYLTPFTDSYRRSLFDDWMERVQYYDIPFTPNSTAVSILGEAIQIRSWQLHGLPRDSLSTENAVLVSHSRRWPLFIDPQGQANKWIKNMGKDKGLLICKLLDRDMMRTVESAIRFGRPVLIENAGMELDPSLDPILLRQVFVQQGTVVIKLGDLIVPYDDGFHLYITTKLPNPHYTPEVSIKVLLVNFTLMPSGLQDQLLALVVMQERADLEEQRSQIVVGIAQMKQELKEIEQRILYKLSTSEGSPLDDLDFIVTLESSKTKSDDIKNKVEAAETTQIDIDHTRSLYIPVAVRASILFFCLSDLSNVDPMYQYSLEWFVSLFISSIIDAEKSDLIDERVEAINEYFTFHLFCNVCRSLFEKHKLLFAFLLCARILISNAEIDQHEWHMFVAGGSTKEDIPNPASDWLSEKAWKEIVATSTLPAFADFVKDFPTFVDHFQRIFESLDPHRCAFPEEYDKKLDSFQKMLILKSIRPDKVTNAMQDFIALKAGHRFIEPQSSDLSQIFKESTPLIPLIFVLSTGTDPAAELYKFADQMRFAKRMFSISLGQGQGPLAEKLLLDGIEAGSWVFFQNCHLAPSFMPRLERLVENIPPETVHRDFRIWLTSFPSPSFPVSILQNGCKMTVEPPRGVKANMMRAYRNQVRDLAEFLQSDHVKAKPEKCLIFSLCLFHSVLLERRKFGPLGFNIPYEFTDGDLKICISQLHMFMMEYDEIPFKVLTYTAGEINYGGRVTDDWDRRCLMNILYGYYNMEVMDSSFVYDRDGFYHQLPPDALFIDYLEYIKQLPLNDEPELFGMHQNANITFAQAQTYTCLATLLLLQPKQVGEAASSQEEVTANSAKQILEDLPNLFDLTTISHKYPVLYEESLNTVVIQEAIRYNNLLAIIKNSLTDLLKALVGLVVMSESLEKMALSLYSNLVPDLWANKAYPSLKPLASWVIDLKARTQFLLSWVDDGTPPSFWISGFYFPQAFLTGTLQNFARKYVVSIDTINFSFTILKEKPKKRPDDGCCIWGLFLEGSRWNSEIGVLDESLPKELYTEMPCIWLIPEEFHAVPENVFECPVYKTLTRAGTLSTTGHSTNYVLSIEVPTIKSQNHWIKRGVALICALDY